MIDIILHTCNMNKHDTKIKGHDAWSRLVFTMF